MKVPGRYASLALALFLCAALPGAPATALEESALEHDLVLAIGGKERQASLAEAMALLHIPSVSIALIDEGRIAFAKAYGDATPDTLYQAASISKFVAAVGAMRLVQQGTLGLDADVNATLTSWRVPDTGFDETQKVTLRRLLSMIAGINVPGFLGYERGAPLPSLTQILDGAPPANSEAVTVVAVPGSEYRYSGGGYEIAEALMQEATGKPFPELMQELVLAPAGMTASTFAQPLPAARESEAASGHTQDGSELPGRFRVFPEHAAAGLWSTPSDLARLLLRLAESWQGFSPIFLSRETLGEMLTRQYPGPYGLGAAVAGVGADLAIMKRGQNIGYQAYLILYPASGQGLVVMTGSDNGSTLAEALIARAATAYNWPSLPKLAD